MPVKVSSAISPSTPILNCPDITVMVGWLLKTKFIDDVELDVLGCQVDILGTNCDQCVCMVRCCFTSTETMRLLDCVAHVLVVKNWTTLQAASLSGTFLFGRRDVINQCLEFGI